MHLNRHSRKNKKNFDTTEVCTAVIWSLQLYIASKIWPDLTSLRPRTLIFTKITNLDVKIVLS